MSTAATLEPVEELDVDAKEGGWDPYRVWKEQVEGNTPSTLSDFTQVTTQESWSPYQVWMEHVARKSS